MADSKIAKPLKIYVKSISITSTITIPSGGYGAIDTGVPIQSTNILPVFSFMPYGLVLANFYPKTQTNTYWIDVNNYHSGTITLTSTDKPMIRYIVE